MKTSGSNHPALSQHSKDSR